MAVGVRNVCCASAAVWMIRSSARPEEISWARAFFLDVAASRAVVRSGSVPVSNRSTVVTDSRVQSMLCSCTKEASCRTFVSSNLAMAMASSSPWSLVSCLNVT